MCLMKAPCFSSQCLQNPSSDIRLVAEKMIWWANKDPLACPGRPGHQAHPEGPPDNTKDKNTVVRAYSDQAIVNLPKMRQGEEVFPGGSLGLVGLPRGWALVSWAFCMTVFKACTLPSHRHEC